MKVSPEHLELMRKAIAPLDTFERRRKYLDGDFPRANLVQNLNQRYRWDLFWTANATREFDAGEYASSHLDTALKKIVPKLP